MYDCDHFYTTNDSFSHNTPRLCPAYSTTHSWLSGTRTNHSRNFIDKRSAHGP
jgi:hypothetical protein